MKQLTSALLLAVVLTTFAYARDLPAYYPDKLGRSGEIDAVYLDEGHIVIDDIPYAISSNVVVHSLSAYSVSRARLRPGSQVAFRMGGDRTITNIWLLPRNYDARSRR